MPPVKTKVNWLQVAAISIPILITVVTGWIAVQVKLARIEEAQTATKELKEEITGLRNELNNHIEKEQEKRSAMWQAIAKKKDKPNSD